MEHLLNDATDDAADEAAINNEAVVANPNNRGESVVAAPPLPPRFSTVVSPSSSAASLGLHMLSTSAAAPPQAPRLPPISLLTAAAAALQPIQCQPSMQTAPMPAPAQLRPVLMTPMQTVASTSPTSSSSSAAPPPLTVGGDDMLCRYRNKKCGYPRAIKRNGERHNLCERHRAKANQNQRKLESKRRTQKRMMQRAHSQAADRVVRAKKVAMVTETEVKFTIFGGAVA